MVQKQCNLVATTMMNKTTMMPMMIFENKQEQCWPQSAAPHNASTQLHRLLLLQTLLIGHEMVPIVAMLYGHKRPDTVTVRVRVPSGTRARQVSVRVKERSIAVTIDRQSCILMPHSNGLWMHPRMLSVHAGSLDDQTRATAADGGRVCSITLRKTSQLLLARCNGGRSCAHRILSSM
jgi:hypothetical protein